MKQFKLFILIIYLILLSFTFVNAYNSNNLFNIDCYQEFANVSNSCGALGTGTYYSDQPPGSDLNKKYDGDYETYGGLSSLYTYIFNYTIPLGVNNNTFIQYRAGTQATINQTLPIGCLNSTYLYLRLLGSASRGNISCSSNQTIKVTGAGINGLPWYNIFYQNVVNADRFYEEGIFWNMNFSSKNITFTGGDNQTRYLQVPSNTILTNAFMNLTSSDSFSFYLNNNKIVDFSKFWKVGAIPSAYYKFDTDYSDSSGNGLTLINNSFTTIQVGVVGNASKVTQNAGLSHISNSAYYFDKNNFSICFWFNTTMPTNNFLGTDLVTQNVWFIGLNTGNPINFRDCPGGSCVTAVQSTTVGLVDNKPHHVCFVRNGTGTNQFALYLNTTLEAVGTLATNITGNINFTIGGGDNFSIDELVIWNNYALNYTQVAEMYNSSQGRYEDSGIIYNNRTSNLANAINNYLSTCSYLNGYCNVPFTFSSQTAGILQYSDLQFNNEGFSENSQTFNSNTYETLRNTFILNLTYDNNNYGLNGNFVYNNSVYNSTISGSGNNLILSSSFNIPLTNLITNNSFYWNITLTNSTGSFYYQSSIYNQTVNPLIFGICNSTLNYSAINFTTNDETLQTRINSTFKSVFQFGGINLYKNYSYNDTSNQNSSFNFCLNIQNNSINLNSVIDYSANNYFERFYYINNLNISSNSTLINLYLLNSSISYLFTIQVTQGITKLNKGFITILKDLGLGNYQQINIRQTDSLGNFIEYLELNKNYRFIIKDSNNNPLAILDQASTCQSAPCSLSLYVNGNNQDLFAGYNSTYADNILSSLTNNGTDVSYSFVDLTNTAHYFELVVSKVFYNNTQSNIICDNKLYSSSGTITCDVSGVGDYFATGYISRSPIKIDKTISFVIDAIASLGVLRWFICIVLIMVFIFAAAVISRGNPSVILIVFIATVDILKLITLLPFGWIWIALLNIGGWYLLDRLKT